MSEDELRQRVQDVDVYARVNPDAGHFSPIQI